MLAVTKCVEFIEQEFNLTLSKYNSETVQNLAESDQFCKELSEGKQIEKIKQELGTFLQTIRQKRLQIVLKEREQPRKKKHHVMAVIWLSDLCGKNFALNTR